MTPNLNRLLFLSENLVQQASQGTVRPAVPIAAKKKTLPVVPLQAWKTTEKYMEKTYEFASSSDRNVFLFQVLGMEEDRGHNADMLVKEKSVKIRVFTRDLNKVTELDKEYAHLADSIYAEIKKNDD